MKKLALSLTLFMLSLTHVMAMESSDADRLFSQAGQAYKDGRFDEAARLDEKIVAGELESSSLYYNLGNAHLKNKALGKAIVNYLRSEKLAPRDADVKANLAFARNNVESYQPFSAPSDVDKALSLKQLSEDELKWISLFVFMAGGIFFLVALYKGVRTKRIILGTVLILLVWAYCVALIVTRMASEAGHAVVIKPSEAKYEPSKDATTYFKLLEGSEVRILRLEDGWVKIERPDGKSAWASADTIEKVSP